MDDGATGARSRASSRPPGPLSAPAHGPFRYSKAPHHRRRRALALLAVVGVVVLVTVLLATGGGAPAQHLTSAGGAGFFDRISTLAGSGAGSFAGAETAAESAAIDRTLAYTRYVRIAGAQHREIALTFDDGPGPYTPQVLSILQREGVPATFFEVGIEERYFHMSTSEIAARGYMIGDHTETHAPMSRLSVRDQRAQLLQQAAAVGRYGAPFPRLFRPPYGLWSSATLRLLRRYRMLMVLWTVDTSDYRQPGVPAIVHSAVSGGRPGAIILLHDAGGDRAETVAALPKIIAALRRRGYRLVTVPKLILDNPPPPNQQISAVVGAGG
jgi:peptidoglycan-N-acetylglucosamine deacetylase